MAQEPLEDAAMAACTNPHFFRPLLPGFEHQLSIPVAFSERFFNGEEMVGETDAVLRGPGGKSYPVKISGGGEFSDTGWEAFVSDHSLHVGDFVVFRYDAHMVFDVMIFDPSACERLYPSSPSSSLPFLIPVKPERETTPTDDEQPETELDSRTTDETGDHVQVQATSTEKAASGSVPKGPSFLVTISRNTLKKNRLPIPREFTMKHDLESTRRLAMILNEEGRSWPAHLIIINRLVYPNYRPQVVLGRGIGQFLEDNGLQLGDTFWLELVQGGQNPVFRMSGLHADPEAMKKELEKERTKKIKLMDVEEEPIPSGSSTTMQNHFLIKLTNRYYDGYALHIPKEFAQKNGLIGLKCEMILRNERGSPYLVKLRSTKAGRPFIGTGWYDLVKANGLRLGDILRFELVETGTNPVMTFKMVSREEIRAEG